MSKRRKRELAEQSFVFRDGNRIPKWQVAGRELKEAVRIGKFAFDPDMWYMHSYCGTRVQGRNLLQHLENCKNNIRSRS